MTSRPETSTAEAEHPLLAGIDIGGTSIKLGIVDNRGRTVGFTQISTDEAAGPDRAVERVGAALDGLLLELDIERDQLLAAGLGCPGTMDIPSGLLIEPPNLPHWWEYPIRDRISDATGLRVGFANDGAAAAYGEFWVGSGRQFNSIVMLTLGTGVGGGIILGDISIDGEHSHGSECGHVIIDSQSSARVCSCGQTGHLEAYASATALVKRAQEALNDGAESELLRWRDDLNGLRIAQAAENEDGLASKLIVETADYLSIAAVSLAHTINPGALILGGAMNFGAHESPVGRRFLNRIRERFRALAFPVVAEKTVIDFASLGGDAGYIGAAGIARRKYA